MLTENEFRRAEGARSTLTQQLPAETKRRLDVVRLALRDNPVPDDPGDHLLVRQKGTSEWWPLRHEITIGADPGNDMVLESIYVSGRHCRIAGTDDGWVVRDLGSKNRVFVNGKEASEHLLKDGDAIQLGDVTMLFILRPRVPLDADGRTGHTEV